MEQEARKSFLIKLLYFAAVWGLVYIVCRFLLTALLPFVIGGAVASAVQIPSEFLSSRTKIKRSVIASILSITVFILFFLILIFSGFKLLSFIYGLADYLTDYICLIFEKLKVLSQFAERADDRLPEELRGILSDFLSETAGSITAMLAGALSSLTASAARNTPEFLINTVVSAVSAVFAAHDFDKLKRFFSSLAGEKLCLKLKRIKKILTGSVLKLLYGYLILMLITFSELAVGFKIIGVKNAVAVAAVVALIDILPVLGTGTVLIPWSLAELITGNTAFGAALLILYAVVLIVRNFAEPKIIGGRTGVNPLFMLIAIFVGIKLFGALGALLLPISLIVVIKYYKEP